MLCKLNKYSLAIFIAGCTSNHNELTGTSVCDTERMEVIPDNLYFEEVSQNPKAEDDITEGLAEHIADFVNRMSLNISDNLISLRLEDGEYTYTYTVDEHCFDDTAELLLGEILTYDSIRIASVGIRNEIVELKIGEIECECRGEEVKVAYRSTLPTFVISYNYYLYLLECMRN